MNTGLRDRKDRMHLNGVSEEGDRESRGQQDAKKMKPQNFFDLIKRLEDVMRTNRIQDGGLG